MRNRKENDLTMKEPEIKVEFRASPKGYFDRKCPKCNFIFAVNLTDYKSHTGKMFCPMCGHMLSASHVDWFTPVQVSEMKKKIHLQAQEWACNQFNSIFSKDRNITKRSNGFITVEIKYTPIRIPIYKNTPILQPNEWNLDITCPQCNKKYSVIGSAYFCPFCGRNNIEENFEKSLEIIIYKLNFEELFKEDLAKMDENMAEDFVRSILEKTVGEAVSVFQKLAQEVIKKRTNEEISVNKFQILEEGNKIFLEHTQKSYKDFISENEYNLLNLMFQRRHLLEHQLGIVDERYLNKTKDTLYKVGERLVMNPNEITIFIEIIKKLGANLKNIKIS